METSKIPTSDKPIFQLEKQPPSIFIGQEFREYPSFDKLFGFIKNKMGVKLDSRKSLYADELTHYRKYLRQIKWINDEPYVSVIYNQKDSGWKRVEAIGSLTLSKFHRPTRHAFSINKYVDMDMCNCQPQVLLELARRDGLKVEGLATYCADYKQWRQDIIKFYDLKTIQKPDGKITSAKDQAKLLVIRLAFGGGVWQWKKDFNVKIKDDMPMIKQLEKDMVIIGNKIRVYNQELYDVCMLDEDFQKEDDNAQRRSLTACFAQSWERIIQEHCIAYALRKFKSIILRDTISCQDGWMVLKDQIKDIDTDALMTEFHDIIKDKFGISVKWEVKDFDEAIPVPSCDIMPIEITNDDLNKGECHIADLITPAFRNSVKYCEKSSQKWISLDKTGLWVRSNEPCIFNIISVLQSFIDESICEARIAKTASTDPNEKKKYDEILKSLDKHYRQVGTGSYSRTLITYLKNTLADNGFENKLDCCAGKLVFYDGILDLKSNTFQSGFKPEDYVSFRMGLRYNSIKADAEKTKTLRDFLKKTYNNSDEDLEYALGVFGHAFTGDASLEKAVYYILDGTINKKGDNGKTTMMTLLASVFPELIAFTDPKVFEEGYTKAHKHIIQWRNSRIVCADENPKKTLNATLFKLIGDGNTIENEIMFGTTEHIRIYFKLFICSNHVPKIAKGEEAVYNRYKQFEMRSHFDRTGNRKIENAEKLEFIADTKLFEDLKANYKNEIAQLIIDYAVKYYQSGIPPIPEKFAESTQKTRESNNKFEKWFYANYVRTDNKKDRLLRADIDYEGFPVSKITEEMEFLGFEYNDQLVCRTIEIDVKDGNGNCTTKKKKQLRGGYSGIKAKELPVDDDDSSEVADQ